MAVRVKYRAYEQQESRRVRPEVVFSASLLIFFFVGMGFIFLDLSKHPDVTDETENKAILGEFVSSISEFKTIETEDYTIEVPTDWVEVNSPEVLADGGLYYPDKFQGVTGQDIGRWIEIYKKNIPDLPVDKVLAVEPSGNRLIVDQISPQCIDFTKDSKLTNGSDGYTETTWKDKEMQFTCSMSDIGNTIAAFSTKGSMKTGVMLKGSGRETRYMFVFGDHGSQEDNSIFQRILRSFEVK